MRQMSSCKFSIAGKDQVILCTLQIVYRDMDLWPQWQHRGKIIPVMHLFPVGRYEHAGNDPLDQGTFDKVGEPEYSFLPRSQGRRDQYQAIGQLRVIHCQTTGNGSAKRGAYNDHRAMRLVQAVED